MPRFRVALVGVAIGLLAAACGSSSTSTSTTSPPASAVNITIGSTNFPEQVIIANMYSDVLRHAGYNTTVRANLGTRQAVEPALAAGQLDLYPDYAGTLLLFLVPSATQAATQLSTAIPQLQSLLGQKGATVLNAAPAIDTNVFAVTKATATKHHLTTISSLKPVASQLVLGAPPECPQNATCLLGLESVYGLHFKSVTSLDEAGPITVSALKNGEVDVAELFSSNGAIQTNGFCPLQADKHLQAADYVIPVIRKAVAKQKATTALNNLSATLTTDELSKLNIKVTNNHEDPATVATQWLQSQGLI